MRTAGKRGSRMVLALAAASVFPVCPVVAAPQLEEVVVSARKVQESSQSSPLSLAVFNERELQRRGIHSLPDLFASVPNLSVRQMPSSKSSMRVYIRGVGNNDAQVSLDPAIAIYQDGVYIARSTGLSADIADLERVEVLRGPQGTLYGRNATGGAINFITRRPEGVFGFTQQVSAGQRDYWKTRTSVDFDKVAGFKTQVTFLKSAIDGDVENTGPGPNFGDSRQTGARFALLQDESSVFSLFYALDYSDSDYAAAYNQTLSTPYPGYADVPFSRHKITRVEPSHPFERGELEVLGHNLTLEFDLGWAHLKSITGYRTMDEFYVQDYSANPNTARLFANNPYEFEHDQVTQELQLSGASDNGGLSYIVGAFYFSEEGRQFGNDILGLNLGQGVQEFNLQRSDVEADNSAAAAFTQVNWTPELFESRLNLTGGVRYTRDTREINASRSHTFDTVVFDNVSARETFTKASFSAGASFQATPELMFYAKYDEGYRTGGFNSRATRVSGIFQPVGEETIRAVEAGMKSDWLDRRFRFNASLFAMQYDDLQQTFQVAAGDTRLFNAGQADVQGLEAEVSYLPVEGLVMSLKLATLDYDLKEVVNPISGERSDAGYVLTSAPEATVDADLVWDLPSSALGDASFNLNYQWRDTSYTATNILVAPTAYIPSYGLLNARLSFSRLPFVDTGRLGLDVWAKNLTDKAYLSDVIGSFHWSNRVGIFGEPRTLGVDVIYRY